MDYPWLMALLLGDFHLPFNSSFSLSCGRPPHGYQSLHGRSSPGHAGAVLEDLDMFISDVESRNPLFCNTDISVSTMQRIETLINAA